MSEKETDSQDEKAKASSLNTSPHGMKILSTQVGGHVFGQDGQKLGMLDRGNGIVLKALQNPPRGTRELSLYQTTFAPVCQDKDLLELRHFLPPYYGTEVIDDVTFLVMNNVTHSFTKPNILDIKIGQVTYDPEASEEKKRLEKTKYPPLEKLGFMLTGMMIHDGTSEGPQHLLKSYCRKLSAESVLTDGLGKFFGLHIGHLRKDVVQALLNKLGRIERWFQVQRTFAFYSSSLLIVYSSQDSSPASSNCRNNLNSSPGPAMPEANRSQSVDPVSASGIPQLSSAGRPDENSQNDQVVCTACKVDSDSAVDSVPKRPYSAGCSTSNGKPRPGQKRGHGERSEEERTLTHPDSFCKVPRRHASEEGDEGTENEAGASETEVCLGSVETKQSQEGSLQTKRCQGKSSESEGETSLSNCREDIPVSGIEEDGCVLENDRGTVSSCDKTASREKSLRTCQSDPSLVDVRMIDFAHVFPATGKDNNYLFGLHSLIGLLEQLLKM